MLYIIGKVYVTKAKDSVDGKVHRRTNYYAGTDNFCGFGVDHWSTKADAYKFIYRQTAERYARVLGGKVIEVKGDNPCER